ncbi:MAG: hypothetical protein WC947_00905 [Elusimicrobiota bacterium]
MNEVYFEIVSKLDKRIRTTKTYWNKLIQKHPSVEHCEKEIKQTLKEPDFIRLSSKDASVYLYYKEFKIYYLCVVVRHLNGTGYIITAYFTSNMKIGRQIWKK